MTRARGARLVSTSYLQPHRQRGRLWPAWIAASFLLVLNLPGLSAPGQQIGQVRGTVVAVTADQKQRLPGIKVILTNVTTQRRLETVSNDDGSYSLTGLTAGDYSLTVESTGFEKFERHVSLQIDAAFDIDILLTPTGPSAGVTVIADPDVTARTESSVSGQLTAQNLSNAPLINEKFQDALPLLPGVVRGPDGLMNLKGSRVTQSGLLVSSLNVTDPVTGSPAIDLPLEAVETVQVYSSPYLAEYGRFTGAVTKIETRAGTNEWKFVATNLLVRPRRVDGKFVGVGSATPRLAFGGPLKKDKLFLFQSWEYRYVRVPVYSLPELERDQKLESFDSFTRIDYNIDKRNRLALSFSLFPQKRDFFNLDVFTPIPTTANLHQRGFFFAANEQATLADGSLLQSSGSIKRYGVDVFANSFGEFVISPQKRSGGWFDRQHRESTRAEILETYNFAERKWRGTHGLQAGLNFSFTTFDGSDVAKPVRIVRGDGSLSQLVTFVGSSQLMQNSAEVAVYLQDKWSINRRVMFDLGLRYDRDSIGRDNNFAPRAGFAVLPFRNEKTVVRGGAGLFYDKIPLSIGVFERYQSHQSTIFAANGTTIVDGPRLYRNTYADNNLHNPYSIAWSFQVDHEFDPKLMLRVGYEERHGGRDFVLQPTMLPDNDGQLLLLADGRSKYREFQITTRFRLQEKRDLFVSYVRSRATGDLNDFNYYFGNARNPVLQPNQNSLQPFDVPNRLLFSGDIGFKWNLTFSPVVEWRDGFPFSRVDQDQQFVGARNRAGRYPTFFTLDLQITKAMTIKLPNWKFLPSSLRGKKYPWRAGIKLFNITNHWNPREVQQNIAAPDAGAFYDGVPRTFRLSFRFLKF